MKVLIAEDDSYTRQGLAEILAAEGYEVVEARDGGEALSLFRTAQPDFLCLDIMMPGADGYRVCQQVRAENESVPIVFISAKSEEVDKVVGLELGADDFIVKPFGVKEVVARIRAVTRRCLGRPDGAESGRESFCLDDLEVFPGELRARRGEVVIDLSLREVRLLEQFYLNPGRALDRGHLFRKCWGLDAIPNSRTLDQTISQLRKKVEPDTKHPSLIKTVHGVGYRYEGA